MTTCFSTASNISRTCAFAISILAYTAVGLGLASHREVLICVSKCLLAALYPAVKHFVAERLSEKSVLGGLLVLWLWSIRDLSGTLR